MRASTIALGLVLLSATAAAQEPSPTSPADTPPPTAAASDAPPTEAQDGHGRIIGGKAARDHSVPWQAEIYYVHPEKAYPPIELHACGGALIAPDWVLTASHCQADPGSVIGVRLGTQNLTLPGLVYEIDHFYAYPRPADWVRSASNHSDDIALVHIKRRHDEPSTRDIQPIALPDPAIDTLDELQRVSVTGWGSTKAREAHDTSHDLVLVPELQQVGLNILPVDKCDPEVNRNMTRARNPYVLGDKMVCAAGLDASGNPSAAVDTCQGDSGGPLVRQNENTHKFALVGIVTFGLGCGATVGFHPGYFTKVAPYNDWIRRQMASPSTPVAAS